MAVLMTLTFIRNIPTPLQVHYAFGSTSVRNHESEGDIPVHTGGTVHHAVHAVSAG